MFNEYNGWPNFPTWDCYTQVTSYYEEYTDTLHLLNSGESAKSVIEDRIKEWKENGYGFESTVGMITDWMMNAVRKVDWAWVQNRLTGDKEINREQNELSPLALELLRHSNAWEDLVKTEFKVEGDKKLQDWTEDQLLTWIQSSDARVYTTTPLALFANKIIELYLGAIDWQEVEKGIKGE
jgi:hypothetical protein